VNSRGAAYRGRGGDQERELAVDYSSRADAVSGSHPATARLFRELAECYDRDTRREHEREMDRES
jgi:hypothetical protein